MKRLGEIMRRDPNPEEEEALAAVLEIARSWQRGELGLSSVRTLCSGHDRFRAMRFAALGSPDKVLIMALVDALVAQDDAVIDTPHGLINAEEVRQDGVKLVMTWKGTRGYVWPMCWMHGEPFYSRYDLPPGEDRREKDQALRDRHKAYLDDKRKKASKGW